MPLTSPRFTTDVPQGSATRLEAASRNAPAIGLGEVDVEAVRAIQQALLDLKDPTITVVGGADGSFGNGTANAVRAFQQRNSLSVDGQVGQNTLVQLDALFPAAPLPPLPPPVPVGPPKSPTITKIVPEDLDIDGFDDGESDFAARLLKSPNQQEFIDNVINQLVATMASDAETCVVLIIGHSDRVDDEAFTRELRRFRELRVSEERAQSAKAEVERRVIAELAALGLTVEPQMKARIQVITTSSGAAQLANPGDVLTPTNRKENRRVHFSTVRFVPA